MISETSEETTVVDLVTTHTSSASHQHNNTTQHNATTALNRYLTSAYIPCHYIKLCLQSHRSTRNDSDERDFHRLAHIISNSNSSIVAPPPQHNGQVQPVAGHGTAIASTSAEIYCIDDPCTNQDRMVLLHYDNASNCYYRQNIPMLMDCIDGNKEEEYMLVRIKRAPL
jgi:hypothetical protein